MSWFDESLYTYVIMWTICTYVWGFLGYEDDVSDWIKTCLVNCCMDFI